MRLVEHFTAACTGARRWSGRVFPVALGTFMLAAVTACSKPEPVRIGFLGGLSGRVADLGIGGRNGAQLAVDELNAAGGIQGRAIELLVRDDEQNNEVARVRVQELSDAGVQWIVGPMTSSIAVTVAPIATRLGLVMISPTSTTPELTGKADAFFRVVADAPRGAGQQAEALFARGHRRLAIAADQQNRAFSQGWAQAVTRRFNALGGTVVLDLPFDAQAGMSYADVAERLARVGADAVLVVASAADSAVIIQQVRRRDSRVALATSSWAGTEQLIQLGGKAVEGTLVPQYYDRDSRAPAFLKFVERFRERFGEAPGYPAVNGYDAVMLGAEAQRQRREGQTLLEVLRARRTHAGLQRSVTLDVHGDADAPLFLTHIQNGQFVLIDAR